MSPGASAGTPSLVTTQTAIEQWLSDFLSNEGDGGIWEHFDRANAETVAAALAPAVLARIRGHVPGVEQTAGPRTEIASYRAYPSGYEAAVFDDPEVFIVEVVCVDPTNDVWVVRRFPKMLSASGEWISLTGLRHATSDAQRASVSHTHDEALRLAVAHVDEVTINGRTFAEANAFFAAQP